MVATQYLDRIGGIDWPGPSIRGFRLLSVRLHLLRPVQPRAGREPRRTSRDMAHRRRSIPLRVRSLPNGKVEESYGKGALRRTPRWRRGRLTMSHQSFWVGWTSIAGWLTLVTTEGFFAGKQSWNPAGCKPLT